MKKTYLAPTMRVVFTKQTHMLCASPATSTYESNVEFEYSGEAPDGFKSDDIR